MSTFPYRGPLCAVIFDWAGTTVDFGSCAPVLAFQRCFEAAGLRVSAEEVRGPMGSAKRDHIRSVLALPGPQAQWIALHGTAPDEADVERLYADFIPRQIEVLAETSQLIPGVAQSAEWLRTRGLRLGSSTGYNREMLETVLTEARRQGFEPEANLSISEAPAGRPAPWMNFRAMELLGVYPPAAVIAVGDTRADVEAARNAGCWAVAVSDTGNEIGLNREDYEALAPADRQARSEAARSRLSAWGAHHVIGSVADLPALVEQIEAQMAAGSQP